MPRRARSPETIDDERYFTVYQPYPLNANWELPNDYIVFARWIAGCIGVQPLHALHHKPSARGMVLLEIDKSYPHIDRLLGEHRWSEFLKRPTHEEVERVTQIFFSLYDTGRAAQKDGWKRIHVEDSWFKDWSENNSIIQNPYPVTHWCSTPPEDLTNKPLCRPLPVSIHPAPPRAVPPVVGSEAWLDAKASPSQSARRGKRSGKGKTTPAINVTTKDRSGPASAASPSSGVSSNNAWNKPIMEKKAPATSPQSASPADVSSYPPGLAPPALFVPPGPGRGSAVHSASPIGSSQYDRLQEEFVAMSLSPGQDETMYGLEEGDGDDGYGIGAGYDPETTYVAPWERTADVDAEDVGSLWGGSNLGKEEAGESLWGEDPGPKKTNDVIVCPTHGTVCKKGICSDYAKLLRQSERNKKEALKQNKKPDGRRLQRNGGGNRNHTNSNKNSSSSSTTGSGGFSTVGRGKKDAHSKQGSDDSESTAGDDAGTGSNRGSVAPSAHGWDTASTGPW